MHPSAEGLTAAKYCWKCEARIRKKLRSNKQSYLEKVMGIEGGMLQD